MKSKQIKSVMLQIKGMTCISCQNKIHSRLEKLSGLVKANVSWKNETAEIDYDESKITLKKIIAEIENLGYKVIYDTENKKITSETFLYVAVIFCLFTLLQKTGIMNLLVPGSLASSKMSYILLFITGAFTSVHCIAMCGGINLSQSLAGINQKHRIDFLPVFLYNAGRVCSYTIIGFVLGSVGFLLTGGSGIENVSLSPHLQGILKIIAGLFILFTGFSLLGIFPSLRKFVLVLPLALSRKISALQTKRSTPFIIGLLNGLMPCGPLQAMWIIALTSTSPVSGAFSMLVFGLGTVPLMMGFGSIVSILGKKYSSVVVKAGAVLVVVMAMSMLSQGLALGGWSLNGLLPENKVSQSVQIEKTDENGKQVVKSVLNPYRYPSITVKKGIPVHWEIEAGENSLTTCNYRMIFHDFDFAYELGYGKNEIEFTPEKTGTFQYTCWMGMVRGTIRVIE